MRRSPISTVLLLAVVVVAAFGCEGSSGSGGAVVGRPSGPRPQLWSPRPGRTPTPPTTKVRLPHPVRIPDDPYAPEPVAQIGTMEIPKIGLSHRIFNGVTLNNIDKGPSHWPGTALPGRVGNAVFAGHRVSHDHPFERLAELVPGDQVIFTFGGSRITYVVTSHLVVNPSDTWIADQTPAPTATLYACHPPGSVDQRYVVRMHLAS